jgi:hypothetical protein
VGLPYPLQTEFTGFVSDFPPNSLPAGALLDLADWLPVRFGAPLRSRAGWAWASPTFSTTNVDALIWAPFAAGSKTLAIDSGGTLRSYTSGTQTSIGATFAVAQNPAFHRTGATGLVCISAKSGSTTPKSYDGTTLGTLSATAPTGIYNAVWKDRLLLANSTALPNRVWFGPIGDSAGVWDTTNAWFDTQLPVTGIGVLPNTILLFHQGSTERLRGTTPPSSTTTGDMTQDVAFQVGCIDARTIVNYNDTLIWASGTGVYQSDGATLKNLTATGGIASFWRLLANGFVVGSSTMATAICQDTLILSFTSGTSFFYCLCYDLLRGTWYRMSNVGFRAFARIVDSSAPDTTHVASSATGRVMDVNQMFTAFTSADNDNTAIQPSLLTGFYRGFTHVRRKWLPSMAFQNWDTLYFTYSAAPAGGPAPSYTVKYRTDVNIGQKTLTPTLPATFNNRIERVRLRCGASSGQLQLAVTQTNGAGAAQFLAIESEYSPLESSKTYPS